MLVVYTTQTPPPLIHHFVVPLLPSPGRRHSSPYGEQSILPRRLTPPFFCEKPSDSTEWDNIRLFVQRTPFRTNMFIDQIGIFY